MSSPGDLSFRTPEQHVEEVLAWRKARVKRLTAADSWLSLIGKHYLEPGATSIGSAPDSQIVVPSDRAPAHVGVFVLADGAVRFEPVRGLPVMLREAASKAERLLAEPVVLVSDARGEPDRLLLGSLSFEVMERAGSFAIRIRDTEGPRRSGFPGIDYYPIDPSLRVVARLEPYAPHKPVELSYETGSSEVQLSPGAAAFELDGVTYRVDPVFDGPRPRLFLLFWDETCRTESYGAGRFLYASLPEDGRVVLDFNQAFNPPCAFTPYAACPLPPPQNRLRVAIRAGEKRPHDYA